MDRLSDGSQLNVVILTLDRFPEPGMHEDVCASPDVVPQPYGIALVAELEPRTFISPVIEDTMTGCVYVVARILLGRMVVGSYISF